jgi:hypothetical protein
MCVAGGVGGGRVRACLGCAVWGRVGSSHHGRVEPTRRGRCPYAARHGTSRHGAVALLPPRWSCGGAPVAAGAPGARGVPPAKKGLGGGGSQMLAAHTPCTGPPCRCSVCARKSARPATTPTTPRYLRLPRWRRAREAWTRVAAPAAALRARLAQGRYGHRGSVRLGTALPSLTGRPPPPQRTRTGYEYAHTSHVRSLGRPVAGCGGRGAGGWRVAPPCCTTWFSNGR